MVNKTKRSILFQKFANLTNAQLKKLKGGCCDQGDIIPPPPPPPKGTKTTKNGG